MIVREKRTGEEFPWPLELEQCEGEWCLHVPELQETEFVRTSNLAARHTGNWDLVPPGDDDTYEFIPETEDERRSLTAYGFTISDP
jgi:hypothetical protein